MKIKITQKELKERRRWDAYCELTGTNKDLLDVHEFELTEIQAKRLALI